MCDFNLIDNLMLKYIGRSSRDFGSCTRVYFAEFDMLDSGSRA